MRPMIDHMRTLPTGTVTFLFTDIEGSTRLLRELGDGYAEALAEHRRALREAFRAHEGVEVDTQGDAFFVAFARASDAAAAAGEGLGNFARARDYQRRGPEAATEVGLVEVQLWTLFGIAGCEAQVGDARVAARLLGRVRELSSRLGAATEDHDAVVERRTLARLQDALGSEQLETELARGAALSLEDAIDLALGRH